MKKVYRVYTNKDRLESEFNMWKTLNQSYINKINETKKILYYKEGTDLHFIMYTKEKLKGLSNCYVELDLIFDLLYYEEALEIAKKINVDN